MAWAVVDGGRVVNLVMSQTGVGFVEVPDGTQIGASWNGTEWVPPIVPTPERVVYVTDFWQRFTIAERIGIRISTNPMVQDLIETLKLYNQVDMASTLMQDAVGYLVSAELLTAERAAEILA